jgi:cytochrome o ubiquinol oxidase subunit 2
MVELLAWLCEKPEHTACRKRVCTNVMREPRSGNTARPRACKIGFPESRSVQPVPASPSIGRLRAAVRALAAAATALALAGCSGGVTEPQGPVGAADWQITVNALEIMLAIAVPTILAGLAFAWWFRASNTRARRQPDFVYSGRLELLVWSIPLLTILFLGGVTWIGSHRLDPFAPIESSARPVEVQVVSLDWRWLFVYPGEGIATVNELVVPTGVPVHFSLTSASVMNAFFVPQLGSMVATMNGMVTQLALQADRDGDYFGTSTQYSGDGFSGMNFVVHAVSAERYRAWVGEVRSGGQPLDRGRYMALAQQSHDARPLRFGEVAPGLFDAIVTGKIPPAPGPQEGRGGRGAKPKTGDR